MADEKKKETWHAWAPIKVGHGDKVKFIKVGEKVTPADLEHGDVGTETGEFQEFVNSGAVRPYPYPDMPETANLMSPLDFMRNQVLAKETPEEEKLMALGGEEITRAAQGPVNLEPQLPDNVEIPDEQARTMKEQEGKK